MVGQRLPVSASLASFTLLIVSFIVNASTQECAENGAASCPSSIGKVKSIADYETEHVDEGAEEDASDADYSVHMQMRLTVDLPMVEEKEPVIHATALSSFGGDTKSSSGEGNLMHHAHDEHDAIAMLAGPATVHKPPLEPLTPPAAGSDLLLSILVCSLLVVVGVLVGILIWTLNKERKAKDQAELKAAAKAWMLDWALGFEPDKELDEEGGVKIQLHKKKQPPGIHELNESSDTDEEEPEAESESEPAFELEEAVYQAAKVEVANEALANDYGLVSDVRLADQILPCQ